MDLTPELENYLLSKTLVELLRYWRFAPLGDSLLQGESGEYFSKRMFSLAEADPASWVQASKAVGWK